MAHDPTFQKRIWKVSRTLDRLALMCEQHRRQMEPRKGMPDWIIPSCRAGIPTQEKEDVPYNFAWKLPTGSTQETPESAVNDPSSGVIRPPSPTIATAISVDPGTTKAENEVQGNAKEKTTSQELALKGTQDKDPMRPPQGSTAIVPESSDTVDPSMSSHHHSQQMEQSLKRTSRRQSASVVPVSTARSYRKCDATKCKSKSHDAALMQRQLRTKPLQHKRVLSANLHEWSEYMREYQWPQQDKAVAVVTGIGSRLAGSAPCYERKPVVTGSDALKVAEIVKSEFLKETKALEPIAKEDITSTEPHQMLTSQPTGSCSPPGVLMVSESTQTEPDDQPQSMPLNSQQPRSHKIKKSETKARKPAANTKSMPTTKPKKKKSTSTKRQPRHYAPVLMNPILLHPRFPPEPLKFRAQSTYVADFKPPSKHRR